MPTSTARCISSRGSGSRNPHHVSAGIRAPRQLNSWRGWATIPHGNSLLAEGIAEPFTGPPVLTVPGTQYSFSLFPSFNSTPFGVPPRASGRSSSMPPDHRKSSLRPQCQPHHSLNTISRFRSAPSRPGLLIRPSRSTRELLLTPRPPSRRCPRTSTASRCRTSSTIRFCFFKRRSSDSWTTVIRLRERP